MYKMLWISSFLRPIITILKSYNPNLNSDNKSVVHGAL